MCTGGRGDADNQRNISHPRATRHMPPGLAQQWWRLEPILATGE